MKIRFIRHGDPDYGNDTLTEKGRKEAQLLAKTAHSPALVPAQLQRLLLKKGAGDCIFSGNPPGRQFLSVCGKPGAALYMQICELFGNKEQRH